MHIMAKKCFEQIKIFPGNPSQKKTNLYGFSLFITALLFILTFNILTEACRVSDVAQYRMVWSQGVYAGAFTAAKIVSLR